MVAGDDGRHVGFESWLDRDQAMVLDFDRDVRGVSSEPFTLPEVPLIGERLQRRSMGQVPLQVELIEQLMGPPSGHGFIVPAAPAIVSVTRVCCGHLGPFLDPAGCRLASRPHVSGASQRDFGIRLGPLEHDAKFASSAAV